MPLMFAYGANLDVAEMAIRAPASKPVGLARLPRHRFIITADGYAGVMHSAKHAVHGLLWEVALADMPALDRFEGIHRGLYRKSSQMVITPSGAKRALIYLAAGAPGGMPKPGYLEGVIKAAEAAGLPDAYRAEIAVWAKGEAALTQKPQQKPASAPGQRPGWSMEGRDRQG